MYDNSVCEQAGEQKTVAVICLYANMPASCSVLCRLADIEASVMFQMCVEDTSQDARSTAVLNVVLYSVCNYTHALIV